MTPKEALEAAIMEAGGLSAVAKSLKISVQAVWQWRTNLRPVPVARAVQLERLCQGKVKAADLRPDVFKEAA